MLHRIDAGARCRLDAARAVGVGGNLQAQAVGGGDDGAHFVVAEMLIQTAALLAQHAAGGSELDHVGAALAGFAHAGGALHCAGTGVALIERIIHHLRKAGHVAMAADDGERRPSRQHARAGEHAAVDGITHGETRKPRAAQIAHGGEAGLCRDAGVLQAIGHREFGAIDGFAPERRAGISGEVNVAIDQPRAEGAAGLVDDPRAGRDGRAGRVDGGDAAIGDDDRAWAERRLGGIGDDVAGLYGDGFGGCRAGEEEGGDEGGAHVWVPCCWWLFALLWERGPVANATGGRAPFTRAAQK